MNLNKYERAAAKWLCNAQDASKDGGIPKYYSLEKGWCDESYQEVSGYIIPTFLELNKKTKDKEYLERAKKIAEWLIKVQDKEGKWEYVFDTGQVLLGLTRIYKETKQKNYLDSMKKAADWLIKVQESDGNWIRGEFAYGIKNKILKFIGLFGNAHNTRTAWALLEVWKITEEEKYRIAAIKNLEWALKNQKKNGYYSYCHSYLHYLAYTASGLLESGIILKNKKYIESAKLFANSIIKILKRTDYLNGNYNSHWVAVGEKHSALTSDAQVAIILYRLKKITGKAEYSEEAKKIINFLKDKQIKKSSEKNINGGITGSYPVSGKYCSNQILSWATKFYLDALLIESSSTKEIKS
jgi:uncharacterized protein YyaL (SSP411 family)